jgi:hypothetical protein
VEHRHTLSFLSHNSSFISLYLAAEGPTSITLSNSAYKFGFFSFEGKKMLALFIFVHLSIL